MLYFEITIDTQIYPIKDTNSIQCLSNNKGMALVPDFLCASALKTNKVKLIWEGHQNLENTFYFAVKENGIQFKKEISQIEKIVSKKI